MFSEKQRRILAFPDSKYDALICDGSVRSGKTSIMSTAFVLWAMRDFNNCNFAICSKTVQTAIKNVVKPLLGMSYLQKRFLLKFRSAGTEGANLVIKSNDRENTFYIYGGKDESSYQLIQGITLAGVFLDEVALMPRSFVEQALARCSVDGSKFWFNCNPESQLHWFNQEWIMKCEDHNALHLHFTMKDNPSLSEKVIARYESTYSGVFYDRYIRGLWVQADGLVYDMFSEEKHVLKNVHETEGAYYISCDFGIQNPTVFLLWRKEKNRNRWICLSEWSYSGRETKVQMTTEELVHGMEKMISDTEKWLNTLATYRNEKIVPKAVIVDPSASSLIVQLRKAHYKVLEAKNDVSNGIADVSVMLNLEQLAFMNKCKRTIEEFNLYVWDEKKAQHGEEAPVKDNDHAMDAIRYLVNTLALVPKDKKKDDRYLMFI